MGCGQSAETHPVRTPVPEGVTRICIAGYRVSHHTGRARKIAALVAKKYGDKYETWFYWNSGGKFYQFTGEVFSAVTFPDHLKGHDSSPFVWFETSAAGATNKIEPIGGRIELAAWALKTFPDDKELPELCSAGGPPLFCDATCHAGLSCCAIDEAEYGPSYQRQKLAAPH